MVKKVLFRVDGGGMAGLGHLMRCLSLARALQEEGVHSIFMCRTDPCLTDIFLHEPFRLYPVAMSAEDVASFKLTTVVEAEAPDLIIVDIPHDLTTEQGKEITRLGCPVLTLDNHGPANTLFDVTINAIAHPDMLEEDTPVGKAHYEGAGYIVLDDGLLTTEPVDFSPSVNRILVAMGGSDPFNISLKAISALQSLPENIEIHLLLGPGYNNRESIVAFGKTAERPIQVHSNLPRYDLFGFMRQFDLAVISFGLTVYGLSYLGVPLVVLAHHEEGHQAATAFSDNENSIEYLGIHSDVSETAIAHSVLNLVEDSNRRLFMKTEGHAAVDGKGLQRIIEIIRQF